MKRTLYPLAGIVCLLLSSLFANAQDLPRISNDTLYTLSGFNVKVGDTLHTGKGSQPNGYFTYIMRNEAGFTSIMTATNNREINNQRNSLDQHYAGKSAVVVKLVDRSTKKLGKQLYALVSGPGGSRYQVDVDNAITSGELVVPEQYRPKSATTVVSNLSVADELTKLKKLLQDSVITQAEYDAQKKKLLNQ